MKTEFQILPLKTGNPLIILGRSIFLGFLALAIAGCQEKPSPPLHAGLPMINPPERTTDQLTNKDINH